MKGKEWENCGGFGEIGRKGMVGECAASENKEGENKEKC
jgi:hypothetical protein